MSLLGTMLAQVKAELDPPPPPATGWFFVAIDRNRCGHVLDADEDFWRLDIFPSTDAEECGIHIPPEVVSSPGLYHVTEVRYGGGGAGLSGDDFCLEVSGTWTTMFQIVPPPSS